MPPWITGTLTRLMILLFTLIGIGTMLIFALVKFLSLFLARTLASYRALMLSFTLFDGDSSNDPHLRAHVPNWPNQLWLDKDRQLATSRGEIRPQDNAANASARG
ncbi:MAG: hypothetical protein KBT85_10225 [Pseudomonas sp.]|nr:hypothetical protein [Pseudomonas sp.]MBQ0777725.1 hypothetical protein [Pseudomonas sp.]